MKFSKAPSTTKLELDDRSFVTTSDLIFEELTIRTFGRAKTDGWYMTNAKDKVDVRDVQVGDRCVVLNGSHPHMQSAYRITLHKTPTRELKIEQDHTTLCIALTKTLFLRPAAALSSGSRSNVRMPVSRSILCARTKKPPRFLVKTFQKMNSAMTIGAARYC